MGGLSAEQAVALYEGRRSQYGKRYTKVFGTLPSLCWAARELWGTEHDDKARFAGEMLWWLVAVEVREALRATPITDASATLDRYGSVLLTAMYHTLDAVERVQRDTLPLDAYRQVLSAVQEGIQDLWADIAVLALLRHLTGITAANEREIMRGRVMLALALGRLRREDRLLVRTVSEIASEPGHTLERIPRPIFEDARTVLNRHGIILSADALRMHWYRALERLRSDAEIIAKFTDHILKNVPNSAEN